MIFTIKPRYTGRVPGRGKTNSGKGVGTQAIDRDIVQSKPSQLVLDFRGVTFMDSSGIGLVMGRYKLMEEIGGTVLLTNLPSSLKKVMKLAGMDRLAQIKD